MENMNNYLLQKHHPLTPYVIINKAPESHYSTNHATKNQTGRKVCYHCARQLPHQLDRHAAPKIVQKRKQQIKSELNLTEPEQENSKIKLF